MEQIIKSLKSRLSRSSEIVAEFSAMLLINPAAAYTQIGDKAVHAAALCEVCDFAIEKIAHNNSITVEKLIAGFQKMLLDRTLSTSTSSSQCRNQFEIAKTRALAEIIELFQNCSDF